MSDLSELQYKNLLLDFYGALLTEKQRHIYEMSVAEDCSFSEIGEEYGITPQAVSDFIRRANKQLLKYEAGLGLVARHFRQEKDICEINDLIGTVSDKALAAVLYEKISKLC